MARTGTRTERTEGNVTLSKDRGKESSQDGVGKKEKTGGRTGKDSKARGKDRKKGQIVQGQRKGQWPG